MTADGFSWTDAATWAADGSHQDDDDGLLLFELPERPVVLTARLGDGRCAQWSEHDGGSGDPDMMHAAQTVAELYAHMGAVTVAARGLFGVSVDG